MLTEFLSAAARASPPDCANRANLFHCYQAGELGRTHQDAACSDSVTWQNQTITLVNRMLGQPAGWWL